MFGEPKVTGKAFHLAACGDGAVSQSFGEPSSMVKTLTTFPFTGELEIEHVIHKAIVQPLHLSKNGFLPKTKSFRKSLACLGCDAAPLIPLIQSAGYISLQISPVDFIITHDSSNTAPNSMQHVTPFGVADGPAMPQFRHRSPLRPAL
jgi:hypothetical protein